MRFGSIERLACGEHHLPLNNMNRHESRFFLTRKVRTVLGYGTFTISLSLLFFFSFLRWDRKRVSPIFISTLIVCHQSITCRRFFLFFFNGAWNSFSTWPVVAKMLLTIASRDNFIALNISRVIRSSIRRVWVLLSSGCLSTIFLASFPWKVEVAARREGVLEIQGKVKKMSEWVRLKNSRWRFGKGRYRYLYVFVMFGQKVCPKVFVAKAIFFKKSDIIITEQSAI